MSAQMYGADVAELERLAEQFRRTADELDSEGTLLTGILGRVSWLGDIATEFLGEWTSVQIPRIGLSTEFLRAAANELQQQAIEQAAASMGDGFLLAVTQCVSQPPDPGITWEQAELALTNLLELGELTEPLSDFVGTRSGRLGLTLGGAGIVLGLTEAAFDTAGNKSASVVAGLADQSISLISAFHGVPGPWTLASGGFILAKGAYGMTQDPSDAYALADTLSGILIVGGSAVTMTGALAPVGGAMVIAGTAIQAGAWAVENREEIAEAWNEGAKAADEVWDAGFEVGRDVVGDARDALIEGARGVVGGAEVAGEMITGGFDKLKGWF